MSAYLELEIVDKEGWRKRYALEKAITHVGSAPGNDIVLEEWRGAGVAPRHVQIITLPSDNRRCRLVNLGGLPVLVTGLERRAIAPRASGEVAVGESIQIGEFSFILSGSDGKASAAPVESAAVAHAPAVVAGQPVPPPSPVERLAQAPMMGRSSGVIGLELSLARSDLEPGRPIEGVVKLTNKGEKTGVQFKIELEGLGAEFYEIGPAPILFPNAERDVTLTLRHSCSPHPPAGERQILVRVTAPEAYPGEVATVSQTIRIVPYYEHAVRVEHVE